MSYDWLYRILSNEGFLTLLVGCIYFLGVVVVRWRLIARPYRAELLAQADIVCVKVEMLDATDEQKDRIKNLLNPIASDSSPPSDKWLWGQGYETAAVRRLNEAHLLIVDILPEGYLQGSLEVAQSDLQEVPTKRATRGAVAGSLLAVS